MSKSSPTAMLRAGLTDSRAADWYNDVRQSCEFFAGLHGIDLRRVVDVVAITSPRVTVRDNARIARAYLLTGSVAGIIAPTRAALAHYELTGEIRGPKTRAFADAILGNEDAVVVDVWVQRALGVSGEMKGARYASAAMTVRRLAARAKVSPRTAQAALWYGARRHAGATDATSALSM